VWASVETRISSLLIFEQQAKREELEKKGFLLDQNGLLSTRLKHRLND
jgi:hypothetical protein